MSQWHSQTPHVEPRAALGEAKFESSQASEMERNAQSAGHNNHRSALRWQQWPKALLIGYRVIVN